jgi:hypothetical protein
VSSSSSLGDEVLDAKAVEPDVRVPAQPSLDDGLPSLVRCLRAGGDKPSDRLTVASDHNLLARFNSAKKFIESSIGVARRYRNHA